MIATERFEKVLLFLRMYRDSKAVSFKEQFDYSQISAYTDKSRCILRNDRDYKDVNFNLWICAVQEKYTKQRDTE